MSVLADLDPEVAYPATASVPDSGLHARCRFEVFGALSAWFADRDDCWVGEDRNVYYRLGDPGVVVAPDVMVSFGVDPEPWKVSASYRVWEAGVAPAFVLEIASERTAHVDLHVKPAKYLEMGVLEYWRFDPSGGEFFDPPLQAERRVGRSWEPIEVGLDDEGRLCGHSGALTLDVFAEGRRLRFRDPASGQWVRDPDDQVQARIAAEHRAEVSEYEARLANDEAREAKRRAEAAEAELAAVRAQLAGWVDGPPPAAPETSE